MDVTLLPELQNELENLASRAGQPASALAAEVLERYLRQEYRWSELRSKIQVGIDQLDRGEGMEITQENMRELAATIQREGRRRSGHR